MSRQHIAYLHLTLAMIIVGSSVVAGKIMVSQLPIHLSSAIRFALALILLLPLVRWREGGLPRLSRRSWLLLAGQSLCGSFLFTVFLLYGLQRTSPAAAGIITSTTPACMGILAWMAIKDQPSKRTMAGILLSVAGLVAVNGAGDGSGESWSGNLLVFGAVVFESLFLLLRKGVSEPLSPLSAATIISLFGLLWFLPLGIYEAFTLPLPSSPSAWLSVAYYGVVVTVLAYLFWFAGIVRVPASTAGVFTAVMPVSALLLSALVLGQRIDPAHVAGCALVLLSIALLSLPGKKSEVRTQSPRDGIATAESGTDETGVRP